ncbi:hypothetical protein PNOK_0389200 [Pyrrhoderma noxium]|uniref:Uncharacterized protein n=1 Tax=Pyrrhoderma noxium TaxID=2282107 RepID=A0A286UP72_9AGAM|nr:hypothetical protein PNOK_0389200 [Pyrrhoderma noxium]
MFGQQNQQQQANRAAGASQWAAQADIVPCNTYLCPTTLACTLRRKVLQQCVLCDICSVTYPPSNYR